MVGTRPKASGKAHNKVFRPVNKSGLTAKKIKALIEWFTELLLPYGIPPTYLHEILQEAAKRAGRQRAFELAQAHQKTAQAHQKNAARGRTTQQQQDLALRRVLVSVLYKELKKEKPHYKPGAERTAKELLQKLKELPFGRKPPMSVRTIQEDIRWLIENGNWGV